MHEIIFYNGFNLLVDAIVATISGLIFYRIGRVAGWAEHAEYHEFMAEAAGDHAYETWREAQYEENND